MRIFSQKNKAWADMTIGKTNLAMKKYGCLICCLAMITDIPPDKLLAILNKNKCFNDNGKLIWDITGKVLGYTYRGESSMPSVLPTTAQTNYYAKNGYPQHFFVWTGSDSLIADPLDGKLKVNYYPVVNYRILTKNARMA